MFDRVLIPQFHTHPDLKTHLYRSNFSVIRFPVNEFHAYLVFYKARFDSCVVFPGYIPGAYQMWDFFQTYFPDVQVFHRDADLI